MFGRGRFSQNVNVTSSFSTLLCNYLYPCQERFIQSSSSKREDNVFNHDISCSFLLHESQPSLEKIVGYSLFWLKR